MGERKRVFISYSHRDQGLFDRLRPFLKPWEDYGLLEIWSDHRIEAGQKWHNEICNAIEASDAALLLVSQDFLASTYICAHELPPLLQAREERGLILACLHMRHSLANHDGIVFQTGADGPVKLTDFQGLNDPETPVQSMTDDERDSTFKKVAEWLYEVAALPSRETRPRRTAGQRPYTLDIYLRVSAGYLTRRYLHLHGKITEYRSAWGPLQEHLRHWEEWGVVALQHHRLGEKMFETLFGEPRQDRSGVVLKALFENESEAVPRPSLYPVRVRIMTTDPLLTRLPWTQTSWEGSRLWDLGWTFELASAASDGKVPEFADVLLKAPCPVLLIASESDPQHESHCRALAERLQQAWPAYPEPPRKATNWRAAETAFRERRPRIVYYYGPCFISEGELKLQFDTSGDEREQHDIAELAELWGNHPPQIVFLNLATEASPPPWGEGLPGLHPEVPLVIAQAGESSRVRQTALQWFHELLQGGEDADPVQALHEHGTEAAIVWAGYGLWRTRTSYEPPRERLARLMLDRKLPRSLGLNAVNELVRAQGRQLACVVAYGSEGNLVELFAAQFLEHLRRNTRDLVLIRQLKLRLPPGPNFDVRQVEELLRRDLGFGPRDSLGVMLEQRKSRAPRVHARPLLLLDWGVRGGAHVGPISGKGLDAWVDFCSNRLLPQCPPELCLLSLLCLERPEDRHAVIEDAVKRLRNKPSFRDRAFRLELLPRLDTVETGDLADFLDGGYSSCPDDLIESMPELIMRDTRGHFAKTVERIEEAERTSWYGLHDRLIGDDKVPPPVAAVTEKVL